MRSSEFHEHKEWGRRWDCAGGKKANVRTTGCGHTSVNTCTHTHAHGQNASRHLLIKTHGTENEGSVC